MLVDYFDSIVQAIEGEIKSKYDALKLPHFYPDYGSVIPTLIGMNYHEDEFEDIIEQDINKIIAQYDEVEYYEILKIKFNIQTDNLFIKLKIVFHKYEVEKDIVILKGVY